MKMQCFMKGRQMSIKLEFFCNKLLSSYFCSSSACYKFTHKPRGKNVVSSLSDDINKIRNIGIMAHIDAGKTTTTERMLFYSGYMSNMGEVHHGDTVMDYMDQERERGITIASAAITFPWHDVQINLLDTPGHVDFTLEVERCLSVLDGGVAIFDASAGVEAQSITVWHQADKYEIPRICYLNKMDRKDANIDLCISSIYEKLGAVPLLIHYPVNHNNEFRGVVDLIAMDMHTWDSTGHGALFHSTKVKEENNSELFKKCNKLRMNLVEKLAEFDDMLAEEILNKESTNISSNKVALALKCVTLNKAAFPVFLGSSYKNVGVQLLMDAVNTYLPSPTEYSHSNTHLYAPHFCAMAFKIMHTKQYGMLTFIRIYSGTLEQGQRIYNINQNKGEKVGNVFVAFADEFKNIGFIKYGNIAVVSGLQNTFTGDTLVESHALVNEVSKSLKGDSNKLIGAEIPDPVFFCAVEAPSITQQKALDEALNIIEREDPSIKIKLDQDTGQTIIAGMGELHLEVVRDRIRIEFNVEAELGNLQVAYRETSLLTMEHTVDLYKNIGDTKNHVKLTLSIAPCTDAKFKYVSMKRTKENAENLQAIRPYQFKALNRGAALALMSGPLLGFPVIDVEVFLQWFEATKSTSETFIAAAASQCLHQAILTMAVSLYQSHDEDQLIWSKQLIRKSKICNRKVLLIKANCKLKEPIMLLEIVCDENIASGVLSDLAKRKAIVIDTQVRQKVKIILAECPLSEMVGYSTTLRKATSGTASFSLKFKDYRLMSPHNQEKVILKASGITL